MTSKNTIYADLGNLRHTDLMVVTKSDGKTTSQPYASWKSKKKIEKLLEEQDGYCADTKKGPGE